jgi:opacity protein-like surface antigen
VQAGFDYNQTSSLYAKGILTEGAAVQTQDIYSYHYNVTTRQLLLEGKLLYTFKKRFHPYVLAGLGAAFNQATDYSTSAPPFLTFTRMYQPNNITSFSYAVGFGIDADLTDNLRFGIGYRFTDLGKVTLGSATIDTSSVSGTLSQSNLYASQLIAQLILVI